ncbi:MAG: hypothetical protein Q8P07_05225 [bacterium]|nr:hypothetical protein [bacterium]
MEQEITLYSILVFKNKKDPTKYLVVPSTISGSEEDVLSRKNIGTEIYVRSWKNDWDYVCAREKTEPGQWRVNLNSRDFEFHIKKDSIFNDSKNFDMLAEMILSLLLFYL